MAENIWFTADLHFGHERILEFHPGRPGSNVEEMSEGLIDAWNDVVQRADHVYVVGDFSLGPQRIADDAFAQLKGQKHLIAGNHDPNRVRRMGWKSVADLKSVKAGGRRFVLCHYPLVTWNGAHHGVLHLHGHSHGTLTEHNPARMDVGVDCHPGHRPFHVDEVLDILSDYRPADHHA